MPLDNTLSVNPISLSIGNPYANGRMILFVDGTAKLVRTAKDYQARETDEYYVVKIGDLITRIAYRYYKEKVMLPSHYYWVIADVNKIKNPLDLSAYVGKEILIPNILNFKLIN